MVVEKPLPEWQIRILKQKPISQKLIGSLFSKNQGVKMPAGLEEKWGLSFRSVSPTEGYTKLAISEVE